MAEWLAAHPCKGRLLIGYSGGVDSQVLLHLLSTVRKNRPLDLLAIHIHHGLQEAADGWARFCREQCREWQIPYHQIELDLSIESGESLEAEARKGRYAAFASLLQTGDLLLTAHHLDDQAETLLMQLIRGSGLRGLAAMPENAVFAAGQHGRPLLYTPRKKILVYAQAVGLEWVEDPSNQEDRFDRNYLRQQVMPILTSRWPGMLKTFARSAEHCGEAQQLLDELLWSELQQRIDEGDNSLCITGLQRQSPAHLRALIRLWIHHAQLPMPNSRCLQQICRQSLDAGEDRSPRIAWAGWEVRRYRNRLYLLSPREGGIEGQQTGYSTYWDGRGMLELPTGYGSLRFTSLVGSADSDFQAEHLLVVVGRGAEPFQRLPAKVKKRVKKRLQEMGIPPWKRDSIPLVFQGERLVALGDRIFVKAQPGWDANLQLVWHHDECT